MKAKQITLSEENLNDLLHILLMYEVDALNHNHTEMHKAANSMRLYLRDNYYEKEA